MLYGKINQNRDLRFCEGHVFLGHLLQGEHLAGTNIRVWLLLKLAVEVHVFVKKLFLLFGTAAYRPWVHQVVKQTLSLLSIPLVNRVLLSV